MELKIIRADFGTGALENRIYEALRKSELPCSLGRWNQHGRRYNIKGLYNLIRTPGIKATFTDSIENDYREFEERRKQGI